VKGDTLSGIANSAFKDAEAWPGIAAKNPTLVEGPKAVIRAGARLQIPTVEELKVLLEQAKSSVEPGKGGWKNRAAAGVATSSAENSGIVDTVKEAASAVAESIETMWTKPAETLRALGEVSTSIDKEVDELKKQYADNWVGGAAAGVVKGVAALGLFPAQIVAGIRNAGDLTMNDAETQARIARGVANVFNDPLAVVERVADGVGEVASHAAEAWNKADTDKRSEYVGEAAVFLGPGLYSVAKKAVGIVGKALAGDAGKSVTGALKAQPAFSKLNAPENIIGPGAVHATPVVPSSPTPLMVTGATPEEIGAEVGKKLGGKRGGADKLPTGTIVHEKPHPAELHGDGTSRLGNEVALEPEWKKFAEAKGEGRQPTAMEQAFANAEKARPGEREKLHKAYLRAENKKFDAQVAALRGQHEALDVKAKAKGFPGHIDQQPSQVPGFRRSWKNDFVYAPPTGDAATGLAKAQELSRMEGAPFSGITFEHAELPVPLQVTKTQITLLEDPRIALETRVQMATQVSEKTGKPINIFGPDFSELAVDGRGYLDGSLSKVFQPEAGVGALSNVARTMKQRVEFADSRVFSDYLAHFDAKGTLTLPISMKNPDPYAGFRVAQHGAEVTNTPVKIIVDGEWTAFVQPSRNLMLSEVAAGEGSQAYANGLRWSRFTEMDVDLPRPHVRAEYTAHTTITRDGSLSMEAARGGELHWKGALQDAFADAELYEKEVAIKSKVLLPNGERVTIRPDKTMALEANFEGTSAQAVEVATKLLEGSESPGASIALSGRNLPRGFSLEKVDPAGTSFSELGSGTRTVLTFPKDTPVAKAFRKSQDLSKRLDRPVVVRIDGVEMPSQTMVVGDGVVDFPLPKVNPTLAERTESAVAFAEKHQLETNINYANNGARVTASPGGNYAIRTRAEPQYDGFFSAHREAVNFMNETPGVNELNLVSKQHGSHFYIQRNGDLVFRHNKVPDQYMRDAVQAVADEMQKNVSVRSSGSSFVIKFKTRT
jgi:hypothetical protein